VANAAAAPEEEEEGTAAAAPCDPGRHAEAAD
jgi:hypothetical protein